MIKATTLILNIISTEVSSFLDKNGITMNLMRVAGLDAGGKIHIFNIPLDVAEKVDIKKYEIESDGKTFDKKWSYAFKIKQFAGFDGTLKTKLDVENLPTEPVNG